MMARLIWSPNVRPVLQEIARIARTNDYIMMMLLMLMMMMMMAMMLMIMMSNHA